MKRYVALNKKGQFAKVSEVSSHSGRCYSISFTTDINEASLHVDVKGPKVWRSWDTILSSLKSVNVIKSDLVFLQADEDRKVRLLLQAQED